MYMEEGDRPGFHATPKEVYRVYDFGGYKVTIKDVRFINYSNEGEGFHFLIDDNDLQHTINPGWEHLTIRGRG
jgi:hypothetical protein